MTINKNSYHHSLKERIPSVYDKRNSGIIIFTDRHIEGVITKPNDSIVIVITKDYNLSIPLLKKLQNAGICTVYSTVYGQSNKHGTHQKKKAFLGQTMYKNVSNKKHIINFFTQLYLTTYYALWNTYTNLYYLQGKKTVPMINYPNSPTKINFCSCNMKIPKI